MATNALVSSSTVEVRHRSGDNEFSFALRQVADPFGGALGQAARFEVGALATLNQVHGSAVLQAPVRGRGDALAKRFEEALKQAKTEPITKPTRDFDLD